MATISKRSGGWFVQIRRKGFDPEFKTLRTKADAERWARERETLMDKGAVEANRRDLKGMTLGDLIDRYLVQVTPTKQSADTERLRLGKMRRAPLCALALSDLSVAPFSAYRDRRASEVKPGTVARELSLFHNVIEVARRDWGIGLLINPVAQVRRIPVRNARDRRLEAGEMDRLLLALKATRNGLVKPAVLLAIETGLRRGELLGLTWNAINEGNRTAFIPQTKTGHSRTIPLTDAALSILDGLSKDGPNVVPMTPTALRLAWNRVRVRAGMSDLHFHDLRHEAISRFAEMGLSVVELALISGHRDTRMLMRYAHLRPVDLARKLQGRSWQQEPTTG